MTDLYYQRPRTGSGSENKTLLAKVCIEEEFLRFEF